MDILIDWYLTIINSGAMNILNIHCIGGETESEDKLLELCDSYVKECRPLYL